ncbi:STAS domain-containing protein [Priestia megaterium]|uniref:STAS domain-containing protein n=1 Tax=Priestia megaterium TaxID=1404 RepID=UPI0026E38F44|nr:STAS domain-containing protein [Priestia megaterium]MDO6849699.1 STAS domain-containing protein [Priestia megaterium]
MKEIIGVARYLNDNAEMLANEIVQKISQSPNFEALKDELEQAIIVYTEFIRFLGKSLHSSKNNVPEGLVEWSKTNGKRTASQRERISIIITRYPPTRLVFIERLTKISIEHGLSSEEVVFINKRFNYLLDISISETVIVFEQVKDEMVKKAQQEVLKLSVPVVPIQDKIAVLPLIGSIDSERAEYILENVILKILEMKVEYLIVDFSGILNIDTIAERYLFDIYSVLRLQGIEVVMTGIRPELAQTVVRNGIDFSSIKTYATVKQAIATQES